MAKMRFQTVLLFGSPGVGKGTQGRILGQIPGFFHLSCGEVFRSLDINSPDGKEVYHYLSRGVLVPDEITIKLWKRHLDALAVLSHYKPYEDLLILDGIPRNLKQVSLVDDHIQANLIIHLVCPDVEAMVHRIRRRAIRENRADDAHEDVIRRRFEVYREETEPVLERYPKELIHEVDAMGSPAEVLMKTLGHLAPLQNRLFRKAEPE